MKIRKYLVSNSSSSSFTCDACGETFVGWDEEYNETVYTCINGHSLCSEDILKELEYLEDEDGYEIYSDELPEEYCPICQWHIVSENDLARLLKKRYGISREEVFAEVKKLNRRRKKLYNNEYILYVCQKLSLDQRNILDSLKKEFVGYSKYKEYLYEN